MSETATPSEPERTCVACRVSRPKGSLIRVGRTTEGAIQVGAAAPGRGAYVCPDAACIEGAVRRGGLQRALRGRIGARDLARLEEQLTKEMA